MLYLLYFYALDNIELILVHIVQYYLVVWLEFFYIFLLMLEVERLRADRLLSIEIDDIRLATKSLRFFDIFFFIYFSFLRESAISYVYTIGIYDSSPTI